MHDKHKIIWSYIVPKYKVQAITLQRWAELQDFVEEHQRWPRAKHPIEKTLYNWANCVMLRRPSSFPYLQELIDLYEKYKNPPGVPSASVKKNKVLF